LEEALRNFTGTLLYISHDRYFINHTANHVLELTSEGLKKYLGNYDDYLLEKQKHAQGKTETKDSPPPPQNEWQTRKDQQAAQRKKQARITRLENEISQTEKAIAACDKKLADDIIARDAAAAEQIYNEKTGLEEKLCALYADWTDTEVQP
jgi:ATP-binding cassette subfamily F protein 3